MKKKILILILFFSSFIIFAEGCFNLKVGADTAVSLSLKPLLGTNASIDYTWKKGFGLGIGFKEYWNIIPEEWETHFCGGPYGFIKYKNFIAGSGTFFIGGLGAVSMYFNIGGAIPIWEIKKGKFGIDFGTELWMPVERVEVSDSSSSSSSNKTSTLNSFKLYVGATYFLPL